MQDLERYLDRKAREIALINRCLARPLALERARSVAEVIDGKFRIAGALRAERSMESWAITETARPEVQRWRVGAYRFSFGYQRADLKVAGPPIYPALDVDDDSLHAETVYTSAGMSAIASLMAALVHLRGQVRVIAAEGCYGETRELLESLAPRVTLDELRDGATHGARSGDETTVLLVDASVSAGFTDYRAYSRDDVDLVIFDTTCFWRDASRTRAAIRWATRCRLPLALVRSHAKLDALGIEYGRLGSIVLAWNGRDDAHAWMPALFQAVDAAVRLYGAAALPAHFPPFAGTADYDRCSVARTAAIVRATRRMVRRLGAALPGVHAYQHGLYLALVPGGEFKIRNAKRAAATLCDALSKEGHPVKHAGSFGFDFIAMEWFPEPTLKRHAIRVTGADLPGDVIDGVSAAIERWWTRNHLDRAPRSQDDPALPAALETA